MGIRDVGHLGRRPELLDVAGQVEIVRGREPEQRAVGGGEVAEQRGVRRVEREAKLRNPLTPVEQVAPVAADGRQEHAAGAHAQDGRDVLDARRHAARQARVCVEAQERLHRLGVDGRRPPRTPPGSSARKGGRSGRASRSPAANSARAFDPGARLVVEPVDAHEGAARPGDRCLGRPDEARGRARVADGLDRARERVVVGDVPREERDLQAAPRSALEALCELVSLGCGFEQRDGRRSQST